MEIYKKLDNIALHAILAGFSATLGISSIRAINYSFDVGLFQETYMALLGFSVLLGISLLFLLTSSFQIILYSVRKSNINPAPSESISRPTPTPSDGKQG